MPLRGCARRRGRTPSQSCGADSNRNARALPGLLDIQTGTLDDPGALPPTAHVQTAEQLAWMEDAHALPRFARFPPP